tara:strand:+ start:711 stop:1637 length:927 start_codon:yes stop_codon:yes gene_type:complete
MSYKKKKIKSLKKKDKKDKKRNNLKKTQKMRKSTKNNCSPGTKGSSTQTCFDRQSLLRIATHWNKYNKDKIKITKNNDKLWQNIHKKLRKMCQNETCWLEQKFINNNLKQELSSKFKPKMPSSWKKTPKKWLTTDDIYNVMSQYDDTFTDFIFIGPVPIDFDAKYDALGNCIVNELCSIQVKDLLQKGISKLGVIFNTDPHHKSGEHWISFFADFNKALYFFDSYGMKPPPEVSTFMRKLKKQCKQLGKNIKIYYNHKQHQFKNSECGVYSMYFIIKLLEGYDFHDIIHHVITDDDMQQYRKIFYREH